MRLLSFFLTGTLFGIIMTKSEAVSWFRIQEMFRFESFHMYGIIGTAVVLGAIIIAAMQRFEVKTLRNTLVRYGKDFQATQPRLLLGGIIFGLGWALIGACPGPIFVLLGQGYSIMLLVILSAIAGTFVYGVVKNRLPH